MVAASAVQAEDWPHWRGPARNDKSTETSGWKPGTPWPIDELLWEAAVGEGSTSPIVVKGRLYTMGWRDGKDQLVCLDAGTGELIWRVDYAAPQYARYATGDEGLYTGVTATPEFDLATGFIYTLGTDGALNCWNTNRRGANVWKLNLYDTYGVGQRPKIGRGQLRDYGYTTAPLVYDDQLIVEVGDDEGNVMGFDKATGRRLWASESKDKAGHSGGPVLMQVEGIPCVVTFTLKHLLVTRLDEPNVGKIMAQYPWETDFAQNIATPVVYEDSVLITSAYNHESICRLRITLQGAKKVWEAPYASSICTPIVHDGRIYWAWQKMRCLDFETGEQIWEGGSFGDAGSCILTADERIIVWAKQGKLALVETQARSPTTYRELAARDNLFSADVWPHIVLSAGRLFCKDRLGNLKCFRVSGAAGGAR